MLTAPYEHCINTKTMQCRLRGGAGGCGAPVGPRQADNYNKSLVEVSELLGGCVWTELWCSIHQVTLTIALEEHSGIGTTV